MKNNGNNSNLDIFCSFTLGGGGFCLSNSLQILAFDMEEKKKRVLLQSAIAVFSVFIIKELKKKGNNLNRKE